MGECPRCGSPSLSCGCGPVSSTAGRIGDGGMVDLVAYTALRERKRSWRDLVKLAKEVKHALRGTKNPTGTQRDMLTEASRILKVEG